MAGVFAGAKTHRAPTASHEERSPAARWRPPGQPGYGGSASDWPITREGAAEFILPAALTEPGEAPGAIYYHVRLLVDAGFVEPYLMGNDRLFVGVTRLTWQGCNFIDSVRDPKIWKQTKDGAAVATGFTVELLVDLAKAHMNKQIEDRTGLKL